MIQTAKELAQAARRAANFRTLYVNGCFGAPMTPKNKARYIGSYEYNRRQVRREKIEAASADTFGFDCICFVKGLLWGWQGDAGSLYGGADYAVNGVPDITEDAMLARCSQVSGDFSRLPLGAYLWLPGHCGIYVGDGLAVEATVDFADGVQLTAVGNLGPVAGYPTRQWQKNGRLPYVTYADPVEPPAEPQPGRERVRALQALLILRGYSCGKGFIDGVWGPETQAAAAQFAEENGISGALPNPALWERLLDGPRV